MCDIVLAQARATAATAARRRCGRSVQSRAWHAHLVCPGRLPRGLYIHASSRSIKLPAIYYRFTNCLFPCNCFSTVLGHLSHVLKCSPCFIARMCSNVVRVCEVGNHFIL